ncbi:hypothetical protein IFM89_028939 [Coptis chinensis]|uniref:Uncharacterized protein n=1 Tax=Coptis chinensis TaxID=261450 RepID=A0A835H9P1_9MAGN|nr:hypothetical protein IFM89_028939 [Coptis chinensis]
MSSTCQRSCTFGKAKEENFVYSPYCMQLALNLLANGAKGSTLTKLLSSCLEVKSLQDLNSVAKEQSLGLNPTFKTPIAENIYQGKAEVVDFQASNQSNLWRSLFDFTSSILQFHTLAVNFGRIQDMVHKYAACQKRQNGPVSVTIKPFATFQSYECAKDQSIWTDAISTLIGEDICGDYKSKFLESSSLSQGWGSSFGIACCLVHQRNKLVEREREELDKMLEENRRRVEEAKKREALEQQRKEEERYRELEQLQRQKEEAMRRKKLEEEEERSNQMKLLDKNKTRPKLSFGLGLK